MTRAERQIRAAIDHKLREQKLRLFGVSTADARATWTAYADGQHARYGDRGLSRVPVEQMPAAIDELFARLDYQPGERLLEVGPGPQGGMSLLAALMGLHVTCVEYDQPFAVNVDELRAQLEGTGAEGSLAQIAHLGGRVLVHPIENLHRLLAPYQRLITAARGSLTIIPGDFARDDVQQRALSAAPFDHVVCTDVVSPMGTHLSDTTAMLTTGDDARSAAILQAIATAATPARTLYTGFLVAEQSAECGDRIAASYALIESVLTGRRRTFTTSAVFSPSSGTVCRSRLYTLDRLTHAIAS